MGKRARKREGEEQHKGKEETGKGVSGGGRHNALLSLFIASHHELFNTITFTSRGRA